MEIDGRLKQSLHNAVHLTLGMERRDNAVSPPWNAVSLQPEKPPQPLPAGTRIVEVFDKPEMMRQLLILGEPGSGKTTTMLELARDLLERAKGDKTQPIPVLLSLSSWQQPEVGIGEWLVRQLKDKYSLREDLGKAWMEKGILLPLLDGLDEVTPKLQQKCAEAINAWLTGELEKQPCGVLICCRREEFEKIVQKPLSLQGAIYLQALTLAQIEEYFAEIKLEGVWEEVRDDAALQDLLMKPLFLSMFGLVQIQGKFELADWQAKATSEEKIEYLFDTYWDAVMSRELILNPNQKKLGWLSQSYKRKPLPKRKAVRRTLVFVAKGMTRDPSIGTELLIERMQPSWLHKRRQKIILALIWGLILGLIWGLIWGLIGSLIKGLIWGVILSLTYYNSRVETVETISFDMSNFALKKIIYNIIFHYLIWGIILGLIWGLILGIILGIIEGLIGGHGLIWGLIEGLIGGLFWGLIWGIIWGIIEGLIDSCKADIQTRIYPNQGIKNSLKNMMALGTFAAIVAFPLKLFLEYLLTRSHVDPDLSYQMVSGVLFVLIYYVFMLGGGDPLIKHIALRIFLAWNRYVPFRFDLLLDYCTERLLMQRIGGGYRFMHKLLQDYFAKMELD